MLNEQFLYRLVNTTVLTTHIVHPRPAEGT
jgi:hypothetical protein